MEIVDPVLPYGDREVQEALRMLGAPILVFAETMPERRQRLRKEMVEGGYDTVDDIRHRYRDPVTVNCASTNRRTSDVPPDLSKGGTGEISQASADLSRRRAMLLPVSLERARCRVALLKEAFGSPAAVRSSHRSTVDRLRCMRLTKSVRNVKMVNPNNTPPSTASSCIADHFCVPFTCCAAVTSLDHVALTGAVNGVVTAWNTSTCRPIASRSTCETGWGQVRHIAVHPLVPLFFSVTMFDTRISIWRVTSPSESIACTTGGSCADTSTFTDSGAVNDLLLERLPLGAARHTADINRIAVDSTGGLLASASNDATVCLWDITTESTLLQLLSQDGYGDAHSVLDVRFHPDASLLATADRAGRSVVWDMRSGAVAFTAAGKYGGHLEACKCLAWSPCGMRFASGGADNLVYVWDARRLCRGATESPCIFVGHDDVITSVEFCPNSSFSVLPAALVTTSLDGTVRLWDLDAAGSCAQVLHGPSPVRGQCWLSGGATLMTVAHSKYWSLWNYVASGEVHEVTHAETEETVTTMLTAEAPESETAGAVGLDDEEEDEEDEMMALRRKRGDKRQENQRATTIRRHGIHDTHDVRKSDDDDDDDEMELLKRKKV